MCDLPFVCCEKVLVLFLIVCSLVSVACLFETLNELIVFISSFLGGNYDGWTFHEEKILSSLDSLQSVSDHDCSQNASL